MRYKGSESGAWIGKLDLLSANEGAELGRRATATVMAGAASAALPQLRVGHGEGVGRGAALRRRARPPPPRGMSEEFENPVADSSFEIEPMQLPRVQTASGTTLVADSSSVATMISLNEAEISEDELTDLTYAFQAADMSADGKLSLDEFHWMLEVMECGLDMETTRKIVEQAKANFATWLRTSDDSHREECLKVWKAFDANGDQKMDADELNAVIKQLQQQGFSPKPIHKDDLADGFLDFDEFCTWFLAQENRKKFKVPKKSKTGLSSKSTAGCVRCPIAYSSSVLCALCCELT